MLIRRTAAFLIIWAAVSVSVDANVVRLEITKVEPAGENHERVSGKAYGEVDPTDPQNAIIADIELAPRNERGKVEFVATFSLVKPKDMSKASGVLLYTVVNRGGNSSDAAPNNDGHVTLVSGWQGDVAVTPTNHTIQVPVARNRDGSSITGPLIVRLSNASGNTARLMIPRNQPSPYPPATLDTSKATLISATAETPAGSKSGVVAVPSGDWAFADCTTVPFPGTPDPTRVCARHGFDPTLLYELRYTARDPLVLGLGLAATRDISSFFRYETHDASGTANPIAGQIRHAVALGSSQSGTFLRLSLLLGFNQDERGRIVFDGMNSHVAARFTDLNRRFGLPGGLVWPFELGHEGPVWWTPWADVPRGRRAASLLDRCRASNTCPKIAETFGSAEVWGLRQSFTLVGTDAKADIPIPENVRRYYFASVSHGGGPGGFATSTTPIANAPCALPSNPAPVAAMRTAIIQRLVAWVTTNAPMPESRYPRLADGTLVENTREKMGFPIIPGAPSPERLQYPLLDYDLGRHFRYLDQSGVAASSPVVKAALPQRVVKVDEDGNELGGIRSPLVAAPLGTYTGWNVAASGVFKGQVCIAGSPVGGFIPFARTRAERTASGDPRRSLEERYGDHAGYVRAVKTAADRLVSDGFLLEHDAATMIAQAERSDVLR